eukprot:TRINITY_DN64823_c0_g1_i1.p1 TRINITY_DN64823_c0_g1~~TRINITY_DN64823_c0_g1_i1.p1  ORF type:complete len:744 (+),score=204.22 TRINITY_DN64823_c0_g1_i1:77-2308(+)
MPYVRSRAAAAALRASPLTLTAPAPPLGGWQQVSAADSQGAAELRDAARQGAVGPLIAQWSESRPQLSTALAAAAFSVTEPEALRRLRGSVAHYLATRLLSSEREADQVVAAVAAFSAAQEVRVTAGLCAFLRAATEALAKCTVPLTPAGIGMGAALIRDHAKARTPLMEDFTMAVAKALPRRASLTAGQLYAAVQSLQWRTETQATQAMLQKLASYTDGVSSVPTAEEVCAALCSFFYRASTPAVERLLASVLAGMRRVPTEQVRGLAPGRICEALGAFRLQTTTRVVSDLFLELAQWLRQTAQPASTAEFCTALRGLRGQEGAYRHLPGVGAILQLAAETFARETEPIGGDELSFALAGLTALEACHEADAVLRALLPRAAASGEPLRPESAMRALAGLSNQRPTAALMGMMRELARCIALSDAPLSGELLQRALRSLEYRNDCEEVRAVLAALVGRLPRKQRGLLRTLTPYQVGQAWIGLRGLSDCPELRPIVDFLWNCLDSLPPASLAPAMAVTIPSLVALEEGGFPDASQMLAKLTEHIPAEYTEALQHPCIAVQGCRLARIDPPASWVAAAATVPALALCAPLGPSERRLAMVLQDCRVPGLSFNVHHESGFELDVYHADTRTNFDLEGTLLRYQCEAHRRLSKRRADVLLQDFGIRTVPISVDMLSMDNIGAAVAAMAQHLGEAAEGEAAAGWQRARETAELVTPEGRAKHAAEHGHPEYHWCRWFRAPQRIATAS